MLNRVLPDLLAHWDLQALAVKRLAFFVLLWVHFLVLLYISHSSITIMFNQATIPGNNAALITSKIILVFFTFPKMQLTLCEHTT